MRPRLRRWAQGEVPDELRRVLHSARVDEPDAAQLARMRARLGVALGPTFSKTLGAGGRQAAAPQTPVLSLVKPAGWLSLVAIGFGALGFITGSPASGAAPPLVAADATPRAVVVPESVRDPSGASPVRSTAASFAAAQRASGAVRSRATRARAGFGAGSPPPAAAKDHAAPAPRTRPARVAALVQPRQVSPPSAPAGVHSRGDELGLAQELRELERIRSLLPHSARKALIAADAHQRRFAHGALGPERELLRIEALLRLGYYQRARRLADRVLVAPAGHPYRAQVARLMAMYARRHMADPTTRTP